MANPIVSTPVADPKDILPGGQSTISVQARDANARVITVTVKVTNSRGESTTVSVTVNVVEGPLTFDFTADAGSIAPVPGTPNIAVLTDTPTP